MQKDRVFKISAAITGLLANAYFIVFIFSTFAVGPETGDIGDILVVLFFYFLFFATLVLFFSAFALSIIVLFFSFTDNTKMLIVGLIYNSVSCLLIILYAIICLTDFDFDPVIILLQSLFVFLLNVASVTLAGIYLYRDSQARSLGVQAEQVNQYNK